jgi:hypothetical protein
MGFQEHEAAIGPVDIVVIGYPADAPMTGEAIPILLDLVDRGIVRVLDVRGVIRDEDGFTAFDAGAGEMPVLAHFSGAQSGLIGDEDIAAAADAMEPGSAAVMIVYENSWAAPFSNAVLRNGGRLIAYERVGAGDLMEALEALED